MAVYYFRNTGNTDWGTASNWSLTDGGGATGAVPTSADDAYFTSNSGNCTLSSTNKVCKTLVFSGVGVGNYSGTFTLSAVNVTVSGAVTLSSTMNVSGGGSLVVTTTSTLTSNGKSWTNLVTGGTSQTYTLADNWNITGTLTLNGTTSVTINSNTFNVSGNLVVSIATLGTTNIVMNGTGSWSGGSQLRNNLTFNTSGTITISGAVSYSVGTLTYISGTMIVSGSTLTFAQTTAGSVNCSGMTFNNVTIGTSGGVLTLLSDLNVGGNFSSGAATSITLNGIGFKINVSGNITIANNGVWSGTIDKIVWNGSITGNWSGAGRIGISLDINGSGTFNIIGTVGWGAATLKYISGNVITSGSTLNINVSGASLDLGISVQLNNLSITLGTTTTLLSDCYVTGTCTIGTTTSTTTLNGSDLIVSGIFTTAITSGIITGSTTIKMTGSSFFRMTALTSGAIRSQVEIDGDVTFDSTNYIFNTGGLLLTSGTWNNSVSNITLGSLACPVVVNNSGFVITNLICSGDITFSGSNGLSITNWTCTSTGLTHTFQAGNIYFVNDVTLGSTAASPKNIQSSSSGNPAYLNYTGTPSNQDIYYTNITDIDSSNGYTLWNFKGTITNSPNWKQLAPPRTISYRA